MTLKEQINAKYIAAFKSKNIIVKDAMGMLKAKITEAEKKDGKEIDEKGIFAVIQSEVKKRQQTIAAIKEGMDKGGNIDLKKALTLSAKESLECDVLSDFLPKQLTEAEIEQIIKSHLSPMPVFDGKNAGAVTGATMRIFKEDYNGQYDARVVKNILDKILKG